MPRLAARAFALTVAMGLAAIGSVTAAGSVAADDNNAVSGYSAQLFASGGTSLSHPDDITAMGGSIFVAWQNSADADGNPPGSFSTVVRYSPSGRTLGSWNLTGRVDGMTADSENARIIATTNEDSNTSLWTIQLGGEGGSKVTQYFYAPCTSPCTLGHGGGTDAPHIYRGQIFISASNPSDPTQPAVYRATLSGTTATLTPVFFDDSSATVANTNNQNGQQVTLALSDPDSNTVVPGSSPRFAGDFMLDGQGDQQQVYVGNAGRSTQKLWVLNLSQSVDDTAWATASRGTLYATDGKSNVYAVRGHFHAGTAFSAVTPCSANIAPASCTTANPPPNYLATLNLNTGALTPVPGITLKAKGLVFVAGAEDGNSEDGGSND